MDTVTYREDSTEGAMGGSGGAAEVGVTEARGLPVSLFGYVAVFMKLST